MNLFLPKQINLEKTIKTILNAKKKTLISPEKLRKKINKIFYI